jgi:hypothetical protein
VQNDAEKLSPFTQEDIKDANRVCIHKVGDPERNATNRAWSEVNDYRKMIRRLRKMVVMANYLTFISITKGVSRDQ